MNRKLTIALLSGIVGILGLAIAAFGIFYGGTVLASHGPLHGTSCGELPSHSDISAELDPIVDAADSGDLALDMWATALNRDGEVCAVVFSGDDRGDQWPGSRVISAQKANTANAFSLPGLALSTANLYAAVQPGGSLFGLQHSNPVNTDVAYAGPASDYGQDAPNADPMVGGRIGGVNVFGGGLPLYDADGNLLGAIGLSGSTSCTDHIIAWKLRDALGLDNVPGGVSPTGDDNMINDIVGSAGNFKSKGGFGHPECGFGETGIVENLPDSHPIGP